MTNFSPTLVLVLLKSVPDAQRDALQYGSTWLELAPGQEAFVGKPV